MPTYPANVFSKTNFTAVGLNVGNFPDTLLSRIAQSLPEAKNIAANTLYKDMVDQSTSDDRTNIIIKDNDADAWVTFVSEGAGYLNSVGYFIYDPNNPPTNPNDVTNAKMLNEQIIFPNATMNTPLPIAIAFHTSHPLSVEPMSCTARKLVHSTCMPSQMLLTPGSPSPLRPMKPPSMAMWRSTPCTVGCAGGFLPLSA